MFFGFRNAAVGDHSDVIDWLLVGQCSHRPVAPPFDRCSPSLSDAFLTSSDSFPSARRGEWMNHLRDCCFYRPNLAIRLCWLSHLGFCALLVDSSSKFYPYLYLHADDISVRPGLSHANAIRMEKQLPTNMPPVEHHRVVAVVIMRVARSSFLLSSKSTFSRAVPAPYPQTPYRSRAFGKTNNIRHDHHEYTHNQLR